MKKIAASLVALAALTSFASAETYPAEGPHSYQALYESEDGGFAHTGIPYVGLAYSYVNANANLGYYLGNEYDIDINGDAITVIAGYEINQYFAFEGRYSGTVNGLSAKVTGPRVSEGENFGGNITNFALYLKPMYRSGVVGLYGLLGVGHVKIDVDYAGSDSETEFQWGVGISFEAGRSFVGESDVSFFIEYVDLTNNTYTGIDSVNAGLLFKF